MLNRRWLPEGEHLRITSSSFSHIDLEGVECSLSTLPMSYTNLIYHIVFRPRSSAPVISRVHAEDLYRYIWGFVKEKRAVLYRIGGMEDHVHMLVQLPASLSLSSFMHDLKLSAGAFMRSNADKFPKFDGWGKSRYSLNVREGRSDAIHHEPKRAP